MITKATKNHIPLITKRVGEFKRISTEYIGCLLDDPNEFIWVDEEKELVCRMSVGKEIIHIAWLLPADDDFMSLYFLGSETLKSFPTKARNYKVWARFANRRGCAKVLKLGSAKNLVAKWHIMFPSTKISYRLWDNSWIMTSTLNELLSETYGVQEYGTYSYL